MIKRTINIDAVEGCFPKKAFETDAAYDLFVSKDVEILPNRRMYIPLGFRIQLPSTLKLLVQPRSGQSGKGMIAHAKIPDWLAHFAGDGYYKVRINADVILGLVDCGFGKEVQAIVKTGSWRKKHIIMQALGFRFYIFKGDRICQGALTSVPQVTLVKGEVDGTRAGLGSTDK